jgi:hypothetical protein
VSVVLTNSEIIALVRNYGSDPTRITCYNI